MAPSWTIGAGTLLAALGLFSCCSFGWCKASRTSSSTSGGDQGASSLERVKRGWVWNQFFVVEEYTGTEPLYVGKVRHLILSNCKARILCLSVCYSRISRTVYPIDLTGLLLRTQESAVSNLDMRHIQYEYILS